MQEDEDNFTDQQPTTTEYSQVLKLRRHPATHSGPEPGESGDYPDHTPLVLYKTNIQIIHSIRRQNPPENTDNEGVPLDVAAVVLPASLCAGQQRAVRAQVHGVLLLQLGDRGGEGAGPRPAGGTHPGLPLARQGIVLRLRLLNLDFWILDERLFMQNHHIGRQMSLKLPVSEDLYI